MAKRVLNRREMRKASDEAEARKRSKPSEEKLPKDKDKEGAAKKTVKAKKAAGDGSPAKPKKARKKKEPPRICARWGVFDAAMRQVAVFDYNQRAEADKKLADLASKKNALYFLQIVKEPMPEPPPEEAPV